MVNINWSKFIGGGHMVAPSFFFNLPGGIWLGISGHFFGRVLGWKNGGPKGPNMGANAVG